MKENDNLSPTTANARSAEDIIFDIMVHKAGEKKEQATINKEYESIETNIDSIVKLIGNSRLCTQLCSNKYTHKSQLGRKNILKEAGNAYRNADVRPSHTDTLWSNISHKLKHAVNYVAPIALTAIGVGTTAVGGFATVMTGGSIIPLSFAVAGALGTMGSLLFGQGTTKHNGVSDANYYTQKVNEIMDDVKENDVDKLKENVVVLTKALVKLQSGLVRLKDEEVGKYCKKLQEIVGCIQKKEEEQKTKNNDEKKSNVNINSRNSLYNNNTKNINNNVIQNNNLMAKDQNNVKVEK